MALLLIADGDRHRFNRHVDPVSSAMNERSVRPRRHELTRRVAAADGCSCSGSPAFVAVVQTTDLRDRDNPAGLGWLDGTWLRTILVQSQMRASSVVIGSK